MPRTLLILLLLATAAGPVFTQSYSLSGNLRDQTDNAPLPGAHLTLANRQLAQPLAAVTDADGRFAYENLSPGFYRLLITYLGYEPDTLRIRLEGDTDLGAIQLTPKALDLEQVQVTGDVLPAMQKGDTTQFNAGAFQVNPDANAEDLIKKMPGVVVDQGRVQAQGEDVREVLVDGRPFFGNDPAAALRSLPAEVIDKIQVFDRQSDQARFTGFDDGETSKTINIITRTNMRTGQFGRAYAGYGTDDHYQAGGNVHFFEGDARLSVIGQSNDINQQNFATEDLLGVVGGQSRRFGPPGGMGGGGGRGRRGGGSDVSDFLVGQQGGISQTHALGLNYSDKWGEKMEVTGSYFFNQNDNDALTELRQQYFTEEGLGQLYEEESAASTRNVNHRFNLRLEYDLNDNNSFIFQPRLTWQGNEGAESTFGQSRFEQDLLSQTDYQFNPDLQAVELSGFLLWRHRFAKERRTLSVNVNSGYNRNQGERFLLSQNDFFGDVLLSDTLDQFSDLLSNGWNVSTNASYTEPVGDKGMLQLNYRAEVQRSDSDQETFAYDEVSDGYSDLQPALSNTFESTYFSQQTGAGYMLRGEKYVLNTRISYEWATLDNERTFPTAGTLERNFSNLLPSAFLRYNFSRSKNLRAGYRTRTSPPSITQLQDVVDNSNPLQLRAGNPDLRQDYQHNLFARYSATNTEQSTVFFALLGGGYTQNYVGNSTLIARRDTLLRNEVLLPQGAQFTQPVNLDGYWNLRSFLTYGLPVKFLSSNLNVNLSGTYIRQPGVINGALNHANNTGLGLGLTLSSNISPNFDFTLSSRTNYNLVRNRLNDRLNDEYVNQVSEVGFTWIFGPAIVLRTELNHLLYSGLSEGFDQNYWLWNASVGKKFLKDDRAELSLRVFDLLGQNVSVTRNVTDAYIEDVRTVVLQQYFMLNFSYQLRNFGTPPDPPARENRPGRGFGPGF